jgi:hypothetical protein
MARRIMNRDWTDLMKDRVDDYLRTGSVPERQIFTWNTSCKWYVRLLTEHNVPFRVIQKGAGVKEVIVTDGQKCPMCKGKGYVKEETVNSILKEVKPIENSSI